MRDVVQRIYRNAIVAAIREAHKNRGHAAALRHIEKDLLVALDYESYSEFLKYEGEQN